MNAVLNPASAQTSGLYSQEAQLEPMTPAWLDAVQTVEQCAYPQPWSHGNFSDSLNAGYMARVLTGGSAPAALLGYFVAMKGVDETHLLNITIAPAYQGQGWARVLLDALALWSRSEGAQWLWLEVRVSNTHAQAVYCHCGFTDIGLRRDYYPTKTDGNPGREDARVMRLAL